MKNEMLDLCPLCNRELAAPYNRHHLIPISKGGKHTTTVLLHKVCHDKIHAVFSETELKRHYHTIERILQDENMASFIIWVQKKEPEYYDKSLKKKSKYFSSIYFSILFSR